MTLWVGLYGWAVLPSLGVTTVAELVAKAKVTKTP